MKILHLSDIHITDENSLDRLWSPADLAIKGKKFDFIVISGDLTQSSKPEEYASVSDFINNTLVTSFLKNPTIANVIVVPGNHDVCWETCERLFEPVVFEEDNESEMDKIRRRAMGFPSEYRIRYIRKSNQYELLKIRNRKEYAERFTNFQKFYSELYESIYPKKGTNRHCDFKPFDLLANPDDGEDYSLHMLQCEKGQDVCFVGLNSCHANDQLSNGACFNTKAISSAKIKMEKNISDNRLRIGVWHHGLTSEKGGFDYIGLRDFADVRHLDLQLVLHGHTHKAEKNVIDQLDSTIVCKGTGTLTAGKKEREDSIGKQFSIYEIENSYINSLVFEHREFSFDQRESKKHRLIRQQNGNSFEYGNQTFRPPIKVMEDKRKYVIDEEGISTVNLTLIGLEMNETSDISLAPMYMSEESVRCKKNALINKRTPINTELEVDGATRYQIAKNIEKGYYQRLEWHYEAFNQVKMSQSEIEWYGCDVSSKSGPMYETISHVVNWETLKLSIIVELPSKSASGEQIGVSPENPICMEESPLIKFGRVEWKEVSDSLIECGFVGRNKRRIQLSVIKPIVGHRYTLKYALPKTGIKRGTSKLLNAFTTHCRSHTAVVHSSSRNDVRRVMVNRMLFMLSSSHTCKEFSSSVDYEQEIIKNGILKSVELMGFFWCYKEKSRNLRVCFGNTAPSRWQACYSYGEPLVGHAFRFNKVLTFHNSKKKTLNGKDNKFDWIVYVPVCVFDNSKSYPIGVVSIAHLDRANANSFVNEMDLFSLKVQQYFGGDDADERDLEYIEKVEQDLRTIVGMVFWEVLADEKINAGEGYLNDINLVAEAKEQVSTLLDRLSSIS